MCAPLLLAIQASLGCGGELVVQFKDNSLIDVPGPDLYVFEVGPDVEPTGLAVSQDGHTWIREGHYSGGKAEVDIAPYVNAGDAFRFVKLVDLRQACSGKTPGADIDAIGAIVMKKRTAVSGARLRAYCSNTLQRQLKRRT